MIYSFELSDDETKIVEDFAKKIDMNVSDFAKQCVLDEIELSRQGAEAWAEYEKAPVTYKLVPVESEIAANAI